jgi:hypothetical protein
MRFIFRVLFIALISAACWASSPSPKLRKNYPARYVVKAGDTLWSVASKYLVHPQNWQQLWENNEHIRNPHVLYPGNILEMVNVSGRHYLRLASGGTLKLSPKIRKKALYTPIPTLPVSEIKRFLTKAYIFDKDTLSNKPYVLTFTKQHLSGLTDTKFYARGLCNRFDKNYTIFEQGKIYKDPDTKKILGYEAVDVGEAKLLKKGDPSVLRAVHLNQELKPGDRLVVHQGQVFKNDFMPRPVNFKLCNGKIIDIYRNGIETIGKLSVVVLNKGFREGFRRGHVVEIKDHARKFFDKIGRNKRHAKVTLPSSIVGEAMVFRVFRHMSYALVLQTDGIIHVGDSIVKPSV